MGLFKKKKDGNSSKPLSSMAMLPDIPPLPKFPEIPEIGEEEFSSVHPLPKLPDNSFGKKFSQNVIKDAVTGKKEGEPFADEFAEGEEMQTMQGPQIRSFPLENRKASRFEEKTSEINEPIFVRLDRFEEGLNSLDNIKKQISDIEKTLGDIKKLKEDEEKELSNWEDQISRAKEHAEKIDRDIFSKLQ
ncbi:MAG TPA: hypothetical protein VMC80_03055 [Patescibacteria group bacterium]|nr:hypothetical protein [Patescibacteria group bacterium]